MSRSPLKSTQFILMKQIITGKELKQAISAKGITQAEAADLLGMSRTWLNTLFKYEKIEKEKIEEIINRLELNGYAASEENHDSNLNTNTMSNATLHLKLIELQNRAIGLQNQVISLQKEMLKSMLEGKK